MRNIVISKNHIPRKLQHIRMFDKTQQFIFLWLINHIPRKHNKIDIWSIINLTNNIIQYLSRRT